jgi:hypothetical protein
LKAILRFHRRRHYDDGSILEMKIWQVPTPALGSVHRLKYSLFCGRPGQRLVGFDNERGKGDHKHIRGVEYAYAFSTIEPLIEDFFANVEAEGGQL